MTVRTQTLRDFFKPQVGFVNRFVENVETRQAHNSDLLTSYARSHCRYGIRINAHWRDYDSCPDAALINVNFRVFAS